jgi:hypothetical protein
MPSAAITRAPELAVRSAVVEPAKNAGGDEGDEVPAGRQMTIVT